MTEPEKKTEKTPTKPPETVPEKPVPEPIISTAKPRDVPVQPAGSPVETYTTKSGKTRRRRRTKEEMEAARAAGLVKPRKVKNDSSDVIDEIAREDLASLLSNTSMGIHLMLAEVVDAKCELSEQQAKIEGEAIARILEQYKMDPDGKYLPWIVLVGTLMLCETPTMVVLSNKLKTAQRNRGTGEIIEGKLIESGEA
jgi:hypothetical protein